MRRTKIETSWSTYLIIAGILVIAGCSNPTGSAGDSGTIEIKGGPDAEQRDGTYTVTRIVVPSITREVSFFFCLDGGADGPERVEWLRKDPDADSWISVDGFQINSSVTTPDGNAAWGTFSGTALTKTGSFTTNNLTNQLVTSPIASREVTFIFDIQGMEVQEGVPANCL